MKKSIIILGCAALLMAGCNKVENVVVPVEDPTEQESTQHLKVNFTVNYGEGTRAVKTGWVAGDKIYVAFDVSFQEEQPYLMILTFNGTSWVSDFSDPELETKLMARESGKLAAAYIASDRAPVFEYDPNPGEAVCYLRMTNQAYLKGFFLSAMDVNYTVEQGTLSAVLNMTLRDTNTIHFYLPSIPEANVGNYTLCCSKLEATHFDAFTYVIVDIPASGYHLELGPWMDPTYGGYGKPIPGTFFDYGVEFVALLDTSVQRKEYEYVFYVVDNNGTAADTSDDIIYSLTKTVTFEGKEAIRLPWLNDDAWTVLSPSDISPEFDAFNGEVSW